MILAFLIGCDSFGLDTTPGTDTDVAGLVVDSLEPRWGSPDEETLVTLSGAGLADVTAVHFGRAEVVITSIGDDTLVVTAPAAGVEGTVEVVVETATEELTVTGGFVYAESEPDFDDTGGGGGTGDDSGAGMTGGLLQFSLTQYTCPQCFSLTSTLLVTAQGVFHSPTRTGWVDWLPSEGSCVTDAGPTAPTGTFLDAGQWMYLASGSRSVALRSDSTALYEASGLEEADYVRNAAYDLSVPTGGDDLGSFDLLDALTTPQSITTLTPSDLLLTAERDLFTARISKGGAGFTWAPSGGTGSFVIEIQVLNATSGAQLGSVLCRGPDNGALTVPAGQLGTYPNGSLLMVGMYRYAIGTFERPDNGSAVDTVASFGVVGTGSLAP